MFFSRWEYCEKITFDSLGSRRERKTWEGTRGYSDTSLGFGLPAQKRKTFKTFPLNSFKKYTKSLSYAVTDMCQQMQLTLNLSAYYK